VRITPHPSKSSKRWLTLGRRSQSTPAKHPGANALWAIGTTIAALFYAITAAGAVTFDEVVINPPLSATPVDLVASDETAGQEMLRTLLGSILSTPPGFISNTVFLTEPPNSTNEGTAFNGPVFPPNTSDALTIISDLAFGPLINVLFISDGASPHDIGNFFIVPFSFRNVIEENGALQDVSAFFGLPPRTVLVGSDIDVPEPGALVLLATGLAGLFGYGWRRRSA
jgi:hypothetical protein